MKYSIIILLIFFFNTSPIYALTEKEVYCYMKEIGIKHPDVVLKQAVSESGHFKSNIYKTKNNLFGFRNKRYLVFESWKDCIDYYKIWQEKHYTNHKQDYYLFLQKQNYSGHKKFRYDSHLKRINTINTTTCNCSE